LEIAKQQPAQRARTHRVSSPHRPKDILRRRVAQQVPFDAGSYVLQKLRLIAAHTQQQNPPVWRDRTRSPDHCEIFVEVRSRRHQQNVHRLGQQRSRIKPLWLVAPTTSTSLRFANIRQSVSCSKRFSAATNTRVRVSFCPQFSLPSVSAITTPLCRSPFTRPL